MRRGDESCFDHRMREFYKAVLARDARFDGKFFVAVRTTGVYCRPICPAQPKPENIEFFLDAAAAERAGYRPCLRCRPECAPRSAAWFGKKAVVQRALKLIGANQFHLNTETEFAARLGLSARHLRRLFDEEMGQTPKQISDNNRLNFARKLIVETNLALMTVAQIAGFRSLRRFNDAFRKRFQRAPSQLRRAPSCSRELDGIELNLSYRPPYDWQAMLDFYRSHLVEGVERVGDDYFERVFQLGETIGALRVQPVRDRAQLRLTVIADNPQVLFEVTSRVRRMFDLDSDPMLVANSFAGVPLLLELYRRNRGLRLPGSWDGFETAVCTILGQLVSAEQRRRLIDQLIRGYGEEVLHPLTGAKIRLFPRAEILAGSDLLAVQTTAQRRAAIRGFARQVKHGVISLSEAQDPLAFRKALRQIKGIGPWSAEYISLRAIGDTDAFPSSDLILKRVLKQHPTLDLQAIKPWRSYAAMYLWRAFAQTLSKRVRSQTDDFILQGNEIARRHIEASRERGRAAGGTMGAGSSRSREARQPGSRAA